MTVTYGTIQANVLRNLIDTPPSVAAAVPSLVNNAIRIIEKLHNYKIMEAVMTPMTTTPLTRVLGTTPANWKEWRDRPYWLPFLDRRPERMGWAASRSDLYRDWTDQDVGSPLSLLLGEPTDELGTMSIEVWPLSDSVSDYVDGEYRINVPYWKYVADLVNPGDNNWFTNNGQFAIEFAATAEGFSIDWDEQRMAVWQQKAQQQAALLQNTDKMQRLDGYGTWELRDGSD
jgi:hypothetical protein